MFSIKGIKFIDFLFSILCLEELLNLHRGQGMELYWRDSLTCPSESEFIEMVSNSKTFI